eukprot:6484780-Amphidinium_carterae.2
MALCEQDMNTKTEDQLSSVLRRSEDRPPACVIHKRSSFSSGSEGVGSTYVGVGNVADHVLILMCVCGAQKPPIHEFGASSSFREESPPQLVEDLTREIETSRSETQQRIE